MTWLYSFFAFLNCITCAICSFLNKYSDALMVVITAIYVIATIKICRANVKAANASRDQLEESRRQFQESRRLQMMPVIQYKMSSTSDLNSPHMCLNLAPDEDVESSFSEKNVHFYMKNIGMGTLREVKYSWKDSLGTVFDRGIFPIESLYVGEEAKCIVGVGLLNTEKNAQICDFSGSIILRYRDLLDNEYTQEIMLKYTLSGKHLLYKGYDVRPSVVKEKQEVKNA